MFSILIRDAYFVVGAVLGALFGIWLVVYGSIL